MTHQCLTLKVFLQILNYLKTYVERSQMNTVLNIKVCHQMTSKMIFINQFFVNICVNYSTLTQKN